MSSIQKEIQRIRYDYRLTVWLWLNRKRRFVSFIGRHFDSARRASFIIAALITGWTVTHFGGITFTQDVLSNYLVAAGAMTGGTIAIVFTISFFLLQNTANLYSSQYLEVFIHDWKEKLVYFIVILITIALLGSGLYVGGISSIPETISSSVIFISLILISIVFALIDWQYKNVRLKLNPSNAVNFLEKEGKRFLKRVRYDAQKIAGIIQAKDDTVSEGMALAAAYNRVLQPFIVNLDRQLENLVEIAMKLGDQQEIGTTKRAFTSVHNILVEFFEARKTSSLVLPSGIAFLAVESDSQKFLSHNFERLNKAGEKFIREGKDELATYIIDVYRALANKAQEINFVSQRNENPILDLIVGYLNFYIDNGKRAKNLEVVFQGAQVLGDVAVIAANRGLSTTLHGIQNKLMDVAVYGLSQRQMIVVDHCSVTFLRIIAAIFASTRIYRRVHFDNALKNIADISNHINTLIRAGLLPNDIATRFSLSKGYDEFYTVLASIMNQYNRLTDEQEKGRFRSDLIEFFRELNMSLRLLSEKVKSCDTVLTDSIGRLLFNVNSLIVDLIGNEDFKDDVAELKNRLGWNTHLPSWFAHHAEAFDSGSNPFNTLSDSVAKTGILSAEKLKDKKLVIDAIHSLGSMTDHALDKSTRGYGYDEPRILKKACYLGILALKKGWMDVYAEVVAKILDFEPKYVKKYFSNSPPDIDAERLSPRRDQLHVEVMRWRDDFDHQRLNRVSRVMDDAKEMMYDLISVEDIDWFTFRVWGKWAADSPVNDEIEREIEKQNRTAAVQRLASCISEIVAQKSKRQDCNS